MKRIISFVLSLVMVFSMIPMGAFATTAEDEALVPEQSVTETQQEETTAPAEEPAEESEAEEAQTEPETVAASESEAEAETEAAETEAAVMAAAEAETYTMADGSSQTITVPAGSYVTVEVDATASAMILQVNGNRIYFDWYVQAGASQYAPYASGISQVELPAGSVYTLTIHNTSVTDEEAGTEAYDQVLDVSVSAVKPGTMDNPDTLVIGENTASCAAESSGYFYTWTAEEAGTLTLTMSGDGWMYVVNNLTAAQYGDYQYSDDGDAVASVEVSAGDELQIMVSTYDPASPFLAPAGEVTFTAAFDGYTEGFAEAWNMDELVAALADAANYDQMTIHIPQNLTLDRDITIPANVTLQVVNSGTCLTIPQGITLTNNGNIDQFFNDAVITVEGTLVNNGVIMLNFGSSLHVVGELINYGPLHVGFVEGGTMDVVGTLTTYGYVDVGGSVNVIGTLNVLSEGDYCGFLQASGPVYVSGTLNVTEALCTIGNEAGTAFIETAEGSFVNVKGTSIEIAPKGYLTVNGYLYVEQGQILIQNEGALWVNMHAVATIAADSQVNNWGYLHVGFGDPSVEFESLLNIDGTLNTYGYLNITEHGKLNISGTVNVLNEDGACGFLQASGPVYVSGTLNVINALCAIGNEEGTAFIETADGSVMNVQETGIEISADAYLTVNGELNVTNAEITNYGALWVNMHAVATIAADSQVNNWGVLNVGLGDSAVEFESFLKIDGTVNNYGYLKIDEQGKVSVPGTLNVLHEGEYYGCLQVDGVLDVSGALTVTDGFCYIGGTVNVGGTMSNNGTGYVEVRGQVNVTGTMNNNSVVATLNDAAITINGTWNGDEPVSAEMTQEELVAAMEAARENGERYTLTRSVTLTSDVTLKGNSLVIASGGALTVASGVTCAVPSGISLEGGSVLVEAGAVLVLEDYNSYVYDGSVTVEGTLNIEYAPFEMHGGEVTVKAGGCLNNGGLIQVLDGTLTVETGAEYTAAENWYEDLSVYTSLGGKVVGIPESQQFLMLHETTDEGLRNAQTVTGYKEVSVWLNDAEVTLESDLELLRWLTMNNSVLRVPAGVTLKISSGISLIAARIIVESGGKLLVDSYTAIYEGSAITVENGGSMEISDGYSIECSGGSITIAEGGSISAPDDSIRIYDDAAISGVPDNLKYVELSANVTTFAELKEWLGKASSCDRLYLDVFNGEDSLVVEEDITIPANTTLNIPSWGYMVVTIPSGVTVINNGTIEVEWDATLVIEAGATVYNNGSIFVEDGGTLTNNGTMVESTTMTQEEFVAAFEGSDYQYTLTKSVTLTSDLTLGNSRSLYVKNGGEIIVSSGATLTLENYFELHDGCRILVEEGGTLVLDSFTKLIEGGEVIVEGTLKVNTSDLRLYDCEVTIKAGGTLYNNGAIDVHSGVLTVESGAVYTSTGYYYDDLVVYPSDGGVVNGISQSAQIQSVVAETEEDIRQAAGSNGYKRTNVTLNPGTSITLADDLTLNSNFTIEYNAELVVPAGVTLTVNNQVYIYSGTLTVENGGCLVIGNDCYFYANGVVTVADGGMISGRNGAIRTSGYGTFEGVPNSLIQADASAYDYEQLVQWTEKAASYYQTVINLTEDITLEGDITIPEGVQLYLRNWGTPVLTVPSGVKLTNNGTIYVLSGTSLVIESGATVRNYGTIDVQNGGELVNNGTLTGNDPIMAGQPITQEQFLAGLAEAEQSSEEYKCYELTNAVTLTSDLTIESIADISIHSGGSLTIPAGVTLTLKSWMGVYGNSALNVEEGGTLKLTGNNGYLYIGYGVLNVEGTVSGTSRITLEAAGATVYGIPTTELCANSHPYSLEELKEHIALGENYLRLEIIVGTDLTLDEDLVIPNNVALNIQNWGGSRTVTIPAGVTLTNYGDIYLYTGGILWLQEGGTLNNYGGLYANSGEFLWDGELIGNSPSYNYSNGISVTTEEELQQALDGGYTWISLYGTIQLTADMAVPVGTYLQLQPGGQLVVPKGKTLTVYGGVEVYGGTLTVKSGGKLQNNCYVYVESGTVTVASGGTYDVAAGGYFTQVNGASVSGISKSKINMEYRVETEKALRAALKVTGYRYLSVYVVADLKLTSSLSIPSTAQLIVGYYYEEPVTLTVPDGMTLTNNNYMYINEYSCLKLGGVLKNYGTINIAGSFINNGSVINDGWMSYQKTAYSAEELKEALSGPSCPDEIYVYGDIVLDEALTIPEGTSVYANDAHITLDSGAVLTVNGLLSIRGTLNVSAGAVLVNNGRVYIYTTLNMNGTYEGQNGRLIKYAGATINGVPTSQQHYLNGGVATEEELRAVLAEVEAGGYDVSTIYLNPAYGNIDITEDLTVPENALLVVGDYYGDSITVKSGVTLTNNGNIYIYEPGQLIIESGAKLVNNNFLMAQPGCVVNKGTLVGEDARISAYVYTFSQLKEAIADGANEIWVEDSITISSNLTVPEGVCVNVDANGRLILGSKKTLTIKGEVAVFGYMDATAGTVKGNPIFCMTGGSVSAPAGTFRVEGQLAEEVVINGVSTTGMNMQVQLTADVYPTSAWDHDVVWSIAEGEELASIDENGLLTTGDALGTVTVMATSADGEAIGLKEIEIVEYSVVIDEVKSASGLTSGQSGKVYASFVPENLTDTSIVWSLAEGDEAYATLKASGNTVTVKAKTVTEAQTITLYAESKDGQALADSWEINILPKAKSVVIERDGEEVTGDTITYDMRNADNDNETGITFSASTLPGDALEAVDWTWSDTKGTYAQYEQNGNDITIKNIKGKTGTITLTAAAIDGSGKKATVKVKLVSLVQKPVMDEDFSGWLLAGKSMTLKAVDDETEKAVASSAIKWYLTDPDDEAYATLTTAGKLTARKVAQQQTIEIEGRIVGNEESGIVNCEVTIYPVTTKVDIYHRYYDYEGEGYWDALLTGKTISLDTEWNTTFDLGWAVYPSGDSGAMQAVDWKSSNEKIATVDENGRVTYAGKTGTVTITATAADGSGKKATVKLKYGAMVTDISLKANGIAFDNEENCLIIRSGASVKMTATTTPAKPTTKGVTFTLADSSDSAYLTVASSGKLTAKTVYEPHVVGVLASSKDGYWVEYLEVWVLPKNEEQLIITTPGMVYDEETGEELEGSVNVTKTTRTLQVGDTIDLSAWILNTADIADITQTAEIVSWTTSNAKVAELSAAKGEDVTVTMKKAGSATITAKTADGQKITVTLKAVAKLVDSITITEKNGKDLVVASGKSISLAATVLGRDGKAPTNKAVTWKVVWGDAKISTSGKLTATANLTELSIVYVTATAKDGSGVVGEAWIMIRPLARNVTIHNEDDTELTNTTQTWSVGESLDLGAKVYPYSEVSEDELDWYSAMQDVTWKSSNAKIVKIDKETGELTCLKTGTVTITATAADGSGVKATFKIKVVKPAE